MRRWAGRPLLEARRGRRRAWELLAACVVVTLVIGLAFAHQSTADGFDRAADGPVIRLLGGHPGLLTWMEDPGTQVPALVLSLAMAVACLAARRLNGVVLSLTAVLVATRLDEWLLKPLFHRTYLGALSYPSGHITSVAAIIACYVVLFLLPARVSNPCCWTVRGAGSGSRAARQVSRAGRSRHKLAFRRSCWRLLVPPDRALRPPAPRASPAPHASQGFM